jgi:2-polyprenyl-3-methyl-5-hydroxy-6-metoxy-1,4-benzoquinol methylase
MEGLYSDELYFRNPELGGSVPGAFHGYLDYVGDRVHIEAKFSEVVAHLEAQLRPGRLLDVGAGPGFMVSAARARGWDAIGLDLNEWAARYAREELGVEVRVSALDDAHLPTGSFDAVTMMDLLEHVPNPGALVAEAARVTRPGGMLAVLTPDAGSPLSRALGRRWPELVRVPEHLVLVSARGLKALLEHHGYEVIGHHSVGKTSSLATLVADVSPVAPRLSAAVERAIAGKALAGRTFELDPRTKFCMYARLSRREPATPAPFPRPARLPRRPPPQTAEEAILEDLKTMARARRLSDWMFEQFADDVRGSVAEVGAGIGTFSERILAAGAERLLLIEPEDACAEILAARFADDARVTTVREEVPGSVSLAGHPESHDLVLCQKVLEHVDDDAAAIGEMAMALRAGGTLALLVPAHPGLYGSLDLAYGHRRRYTRGAVRSLMETAGLEVRDIRSFNLLGVPGWWMSSRLQATSVNPRLLPVYETLLRPWRRLEDRIRPPWGLSLVAHAVRRPA